MPPRKLRSLESKGLPGRWPGGSERALDRLAAAVAETQAVQLVVLGDFWHSREGRTASVASELAAWRAARSGLRVDVVRGNHDRAGPLPAGWGGWSDLVVAPPFVFAHYPEPSAAGYVLAGHLHPGVVLGRERLRLPCFWFGPSVGVLPAFGEFTGAAAVRARRGDRVFAVAGDAVIDASGQ